MKEILEKYSTRLVNVSGRNKSLVTRKLYKKRAFDIVTLNEFKEDINDEILEFLIKRSKGTVEITEDPYKWYENKVKALKKEHKANSTKEIDKLKNSEDFTKEKLKALEVKLETQYENEDSKLRKKQEKIIAYSNSIKALVKEVKAIEKETGRYELYIGYPFVEGCFKDKTFTKAPLLLFPVVLIKEGEIWSLKNKVDLPVLLNKVLLIAYAKFNEEKLADIKTEFDDLSSFGDDILKGIVSYLSKAKINFIYNEDGIEKFKETTKEIEKNILQGN